MHPRERRAVPETTFASPPGHDYRAATWAGVSALTCAEGKAKYLTALSWQIFLTIVPINSSSLGSSPASTSLPRRLQSTRRKYSWRGNDMKERESVVMPTKRDSNPQFDRVFNCHSIPSFWSRNHQALPYWSLPARLPS